MESNCFFNIKPFGIFLRNILLLSGLAISFGLNAQNRELDSLLNVLSKTKGDKSGIYNELHEKLKKIDKKQALEYLDKAYVEANKNKNKVTLGAILNNAGIYQKSINQYDTALVLYNQSLSIREALKDTSGQSKVLNSIGLLYYEMSQYRKAVTFTERALVFKLALKDKKGAGISYNSLGNIYNKWEKNKEAIENYQKALKMFEEAKLPDGVASCYNNIGLIYQNLSKERDTILHNKALEYYGQALKISTDADNKKEIANAQSNMSNIFSAKAEQYRNLRLINKNKPELALQYSNVSERYFLEAVYYSEQSAKNREAVGDKKGLIGSYIGLGAIFINKNDGKHAMEYFDKALPLSIEIGDVYQQTIIFSYLGMANIQLGRYAEAILQLDKSLEIAQKNGIKREYPYIYKSLSEAYDSLNNYFLAYKYHKLFKAFQDTAYSDETRNVITELQTRYETDQKEAALELANQQNEKQQLKSRQQQLIIYGFLGVFGIIIIFSVIVFQQFRQIRRKNAILQAQKIEIQEANEELNQQNEEISAQRDEIQKQKDHIEHIHKEVSDSIHYAERIQKAILPKVDDIHNVVDDHFILFKPKDIVSGDFYWMKHLDKSKVLIATAADCTGHGVPGAFMSMLGIAFLNEIVTKPDVQTSGHVLDNLRQSVIKSLHQTGKEGEAQDGMDISLVAIFYEKQMLQFSGANNPLYIIRSKDLPEIPTEKTAEDDTHRLYEIKGDKMPIGIYKKELVDFKTNEIPLFKGDLIYMFSDGYADQFGGPDGKKLKYKPFKEILLGLRPLPMSVQSNELHDRFVRWVGDLHQIDDVIIVGIRI